MMDSKQTDGPLGEKKAPEFSVRIAKDRHEAFLSVSGAEPDEELSENDIKEYLTGQGVVYGLMSGNIHSFCTHHSHEVRCAEGVLPVDEDDAEMQYLFRTDGGRTPVKREDGTVDFGDLGIVQDVKKGDVLCRIIPPKPGKDGIDIFGKPVLHRKCRLPSFPSGHNTVLSDDKLELRAAIDGCIEYHKDLLNINDTFYVRGNVDGSSGNINFTGTVVIQGDVTEGYSVKAGGDITVHGLVAGATLSAGGNITVSNGVNGMSGGSLTAGGDITARYFQNATLKCSGDIYADVLMNCDAQAGNCISLRGPNSSLMGGRCIAGQQIYAKTIGTPNNVRTDVCLDSPELNSAMMGVSTRASQLAGLKQKIAAEEQTQANLEKQVEMVKKALDAGNRSPQFEVLLKTLLQHSEKSKAAEENWRRREEELEQAPLATTIDFNVIAIRTIYAGTKITIGTYNKYLSSDYSNTKFYYLNDDIISGPVLPSDEKDY